MNDLEIERRIEGHIESRKTYWTGLYLLSAGLTTILIWIWKNFTKN